jgi:uncharacterized protein (DUF305 family)
VKVLFQSLFHWAQEALCPVFLMLVPMALIMMGFMWSMDPNKQRNALIMGGSLVPFVLVINMVHSQSFSGDTLWLKALIPHHSIAILVSKRADLKTPR